MYDRFFIRATLPPLCVAAPSQFRGQSAGARLNIDAKQATDNNGVFTFTNLSSGIYQSLWRAVNRSLLNPWPLWRARDTNFRLWSCAWSLRPQQ
jgi:hypothetical protein